MNERKAYIETIIYEQCKYLQDAISFSRQANNRWLDDEDIYSLYFIEDKDAIEDQNTIDYLTLDGEDYAIAGNCMDIAKSIEEGTAFGIGNQANDFIIVLKDTTIELWNFTYDEEHSEGYLETVLKTKEERDELVLQLKVLNQYQEEIFDRGMNLLYVNKMIELIEKMNENEDSEKVIKLTQAEIDKLVDEKVARKLEILKTDMKMENIENPVIVEKEVEKVVYEEKEVIKEVIVKKCENVHGMYS